MKRIDFHWVENTWTYANKKQIPQSIEKNAEFYFIENEREIQNQNNSYLVKFDCINSKDELFSAYSTNLKFPSYFGFNWDALFDCLKDLDWIEQKTIIIYHLQLPQLNEKDLKIYLEILRDVVGHWKKCEEHFFEFYFNMQDCDKVQQLI